MTQKSIETFIDEITSIPPSKNYPSIKTEVYHFDDTCSLDKLDLKEYVIENNRKYSYILYIIDSFSKFGWTIPLKNKKAQIITDSFKKIFVNSKKETNINPHRSW